VWDCGGNLYPIYFGHMLEMNSLLLRGCVPSS
jgi:hypothetical protein